MRDGMRDIVVEGAHQARNASPIAIPIIGEYLGWFTLDNTIKFMGAVYLVLQIGYLAWKWRKEKKEHARKLQEAASDEIC